MTLENIKLDVDYVRSQFPAFKDPLSKDWSFFENAGGSYVPKNVIDKLTEFMTWESEALDPQPKVEFSYKTGRVPKTTYFQKESKKNYKKLIIYSKILIKLV